MAIERKITIIIQKSHPCSLYRLLNALGTRQQLHSKVPVVFLSTHAEERILVLPDLCAFLHRHSLLILPIWNSRGD